MYFTFAYVCLPMNVTHVQMSTEATALPVAGITGGGEHPWVLETKTGSSERAARTLNPQVMLY